MVAVLIAVTAASIGGSYAYARSGVPHARTIMRARYGSRGLAFTPFAPPAEAADANNDLSRNGAHPSAGQDAGTPFLTQAHALARGDFAVACSQFSDVTLLSLARSLAAARGVCVRQLRSLRLDQVQRRRLASTRIVMFASTTVARAW